MLKYEDKVSQHWPEFACDDDPNKNNLTIADILRHEAGLQTFDVSVNIEDCFPENIPSNNIGKVLETQRTNIPTSGNRLERRILHEHFGGS